MGTNTYALHDVEEIAKNPQEWSINQINLISFFQSQFKHVKMEELGWYWSMAWASENRQGLASGNKSTLHCLIEDMCLLFGRTVFLLDAFYCTLDDNLKDWHVYYCTLDFD